MFDLTTSEDFYSMLVEDFDDFAAAPHSARRALHCAITAYHLHEWVWGDWLNRDHAAWKTMGIRDLESFRSWIYQSCVWFSVVQELANGTKHFRRDQGLETMLVGADAGGPYGPGYLVIDFGEGAGEQRWLPAGLLLEVIVRFWRDFFKRYRPSPDLPVSTHHSD